jgi:predicted GNAT family acetyltransferase
MTNIVRDNPELNRYEIEVDGQVAGFTEYYLHNSVAAFIHTEIETEYGGRGLATELIRSALEDARARGLKVEPFCPFVRGFITKNPDFRELVPANEWERFGLR